MKKKLLMEFIGTFFFVLVIAMTGNPVAIGFALVALVYMGGYISGAHYNPAVTLALWMNSRITSEIARAYIVVQFAGGAAAAVLYSILAGSTFVPRVGTGVGYGAAGVVEILFTFLLASVVLHVAATEKTKGNQYFGLAIGLTLLVGIYAGGQISGGVFNPAVGVGPLLYNFPNAGSNINDIILYAVAPLLGGALAGWVYSYMSEPDVPPVKARKA